MKKGDQKLKGSDSPLDNLRIERTNYSQEEFAKCCGIPLRTYTRWILGETQAKLTPAQIKAMCRELNLTVDEIPDDFSKSTQPQK